MTAVADLRLHFEKLIQNRPGYCALCRRSGDYQNLPIWWLDSH
jgi:hypothetical protein